MDRRTFLKRLGATVVAVPFVPGMLKGMEWAAPTPAQAATAGRAGYSCVVPPGSILPYVGPEAPPGFLLCDGAEIPVALYPKLYSAIGDAFGASPGRRLRWRKFRVPDLRASSRPAAAQQLDEYAVAHGNPPAYLTPNFAYVIKS
jgi:hypothetical protein